MRETGDFEALPRRVRGTLFVVSTPIGNLEDITLRALKVLGSVDLVAAEDTRTTGNLLRHFNISKPLQSYHSYNEVQRVSSLIAKLNEGLSIALVSDAGTPGISDPAYRLVCAAIDEDLPVVAVPGASAMLAAIVASGCSTSPFVFEGFLPTKKGRATAIRRLCEERRTVIVYESPHRILRTLRELFALCPDRTVCVSREITKKFEEHVRGTLPHIIENFEHKPPRGEFVLTIGALPLTSPT